MNTKSLIWGFALIALGTLFLLENLTGTDLGMLWPLFPLALGVIFWGFYLKDRKKPGLIMPGSILLVIGALFMLCEWGRWGWMEFLWPVFILAPGIGFFAMALLTKERSHWLPGTILTLVAAIFFFLESDHGQFWPVLLILAGLILIFSQSLRKTAGKSDTP